jgi:hypothetical protein
MLVWNAPLALYSFFGGAFVAKADSFGMDFGRVVSMKVKGL